MSLKSDKRLVHVFPFNFLDVKYSPNSQLLVRFSSVFNHIEITGITGENIWKRCSGCKINDCIFTRDSKYIIVCLPNSNIVKMRVDDGEIIWLASHYKYDWVYGNYEFSNYPQTCCLDVSGELLYTLTKDGYIHLWNLDGDKIWSHRIDHDTCDIEKDVYGYPKYTDDGSIIVCVDHSRFDPESMCGSYKYYTIDIYGNTSSIEKSDIPHEDHPYKNKFHLISPDNNTAIQVEEEFRSTIMYYLPTFKWSPDNHKLLWNTDYPKIVETLMMIKDLTNSEISLLPNELIFMIINYIIE